MLDRWTGSTGQVVFEGGLGSISRKKPRRAEVKASLTFAVCQATREDSHDHHQAEDCQPRMAAMLGFASILLQQGRQTGRLADWHPHKSTGRPLLSQASLISDPAGWVCLLKTIRARMHDLHLAASPFDVLPTHTYPSRIEGDNGARHPLYKI